MKITAIAACSTCKKQFALQCNHNKIENAMRDAGLKFAWVGSACDSDKWIADGSPQICADCQAKLNEIRKRHDKEMQEFFAPCEEPKS